MGELKGLYISEDLHRRVKEMAAREGVTIREAVEGILKAELQGTAHGDDRDKPRARRGNRRG